MAVVFSNGTATVLPIQPGYFGLVEVEDARVSSISFETTRYPLSKTSTFANMTRAVAGAVSRAGLLTELASDESGWSGTPSLEELLYDPTIAIYAAYAYELAGSGGADRIYKALLNTGHMASMPFDIALLAGELEWRGRTAVAPACPMLSVGWSLLDSYARLPDWPLDLKTLAARRLPAEWTTFRADDITRYASLFEEGL